MPSCSNSGASTSAFSKGRNILHLSSPFPFGKHLNSLLTSCIMSNQLNIFMGFSQPCLWLGEETEAPSPRAEAGLTPWHWRVSKQQRALHLTLPAREPGMAQRVPYCRKEGGPGSALTKRSQRDWRLENSQGPVWKWWADPHPDRSIRNACAMVMGDGASAPASPRAGNRGWGRRGTALAGNDPSC